MIIEGLIKIITKIAGIREDVYRRKFIITFTGTGAYLIEEDFLRLAIFATKHCIYTKTGIDKYIEITEQEYKKFCRIIPSSRYTPREQIWVNDMQLLRRIVGNYSPRNIKIGYSEGNRWIDFILASKENRIQITSSNNRVLNNADKLPPKNIVKFMLNSSDCSFDDDVPNYKLEKECLNFNINQVQVN